MEFKKGDINQVIIQRLVKFIDQRGFLMETFRSDNLPEGLRPQMSYISLTEPLVARGPHEHRDQTDIFSFVGPGNFMICLWDNRKDSSSYGNRMVVFGGADNPLTMIVPPGVVHAYKNISRTTSGMVLNFPDKLYAGKGKKEPVDEVRHEDEKDIFFEDFSKI